MKILLYTDNHFCEKSSIINKYGEKYTYRLENQLKSINWAEEQAVSNNCDCVICLGDLFDKAYLSDQEITAVKDIKWANLKHYFVVGNHESSVHDLSFSTTKIVEDTNREIISSIKTVMANDTELCFLPYVVESDRKPLADYFSKTNNRRIIFSHNDIAGIQMGPVISKYGFKIDEIDDNCDLFINGHLHNGQQISKKLVNLGNLTGQNFSEDANRYTHNIMILDTDTLQMTKIENPFALNFYKLEINKKDEISQLTNLKNNAVVSIKCLDYLVAEVREVIANANNILDSRIIQIQSNSGNEIVDITELTVDHIEKFIQLCTEKLGDSDVLKSEIAEICK